jgi:anti-sigma regulatory factor (Ser/Thr protein kinase)
MKPMYATVTIPNRVEALRQAADFIIRSAHDMSVPAASDALFAVAITEALNNALKHGNTVARPDTQIVCELERMDHQLTVRILDQGPGFVLPPAPRPEIAASDIMAVPESGYGIPIIQRMFPVVRTISRPGKSGIEMSLTF